MIRDISLFFQKHYRWEFLPSYIFDIPIYIYRMYLSIKSWSLMFFSNINPWMFFSWMAWYGKFDWLKRFDANLVPKTIFFSPDVSIQKIDEKLREQNIDYPFIAKPDLWSTWRDVKKIRDTVEMRLYLENIKEDFLIQEFIDYPLEFWVFYYRLPCEERWHITWIVKKTFMFIQWDWKSKFRKLVFKHPRAKYYYRSFEKTFKSEREKVLEEGKTIQLNYLWNHVRGSAFYDSSNLINSELEKIFDDVSKQIDWFYFWRYDIKAKSEEDLYKWEFKILELNGAGSLPMHVYDPNYGILKARRCFLHHRKIIYQISKINLDKWYKYMSLKEWLEIAKKFWI